MCGGGTPQAPKTYQPSEAVNGTWTPVKDYTQAERDAIMAEANTPTLLTFEEEAGTRQYMGVDSMAQERARQQIADRAGQAAADANKLAATPQQEAKAVRAPGSKVGATGGAGGPTSLITAGTAASALAVRKAPNSTLLGG